VDSFIGEIAALITAFAFSITSICFTFAGRKVNAITSMAMSLPISWIAIVGIHLITQGVPLPMSASPDRWFYLGASGILAFVVASYFMLNAFQQVGPRLTMLIMSFAPVLSAVLAWIFIGETLPANAAFGIAVVIFGIVSVVSERRRPPQNVADTNKNLWRGLLFACLATSAQSMAFVFSSLGVTDDYPPFSATLIRITVGIIALWVLIAFQGKVRATVRVFNGDTRLLWLLMGAALSGPVFAGSLLLLAFQHIPVGVATTLSHTTAIILIPIGYFLFNERITLRAVVGTVVTVIGIGILFT